MGESSGPPPASAQRLRHNIELDISREQAAIKAVSQEINITENAIISINKIDALLKQQAKEAAEQFIMRALKGSAARTIPFLICFVNGLQKIGFFIVDDMKPFYRLLNTDNTEKRVERGGIEKNVELHTIVATGRLEHLRNMFGENGTSDSFNRRMWKTMKSLRRTVFKDVSEAMPKVLPKLDAYVAELIPSRLKASPVVARPAFNGWAKLAMCSQLLVFIFEPQVYLPDVPTLLIDKRTKHVLRLLTRHSAVLSDEWKTFFWGADEICRWLVDGRGWQSRESTSFLAEGVRHAKGLCVGGL